MKFSWCMLMNMALSILALPLNNTTTNTTMFHSLDVGVAANPFHVRNLKQLATKYSYLLKEPKKGEKQLLFYLEDTNTYLTRPTEQQAQEILDGVGVKSAGWLWGGSKKDPQNKLENWLEFGFEDEETFQYPGIIPISACQTQNANATGSFTFEYNAGDGIAKLDTFTPGFGISFPGVSLSAGGKLSITNSETTSITGTVSCSLKAGQTGQTFLRPNYVQFTGKSRRVQFDEALIRFLVPSSFENFEDLTALVKSLAYQIDCATDDVVKLYCEEPLGEPNWESPLKFVKVD